ncbi:MAG: ATPase [Prevotellaceae bacterium]|jgi:N-acetylglucosamine kinase-like BadF-type ATPase|nr:ATPase [Prevotellaceae bacterium]
MILLADGGSTKVDWCVVNRGQLVKQVFTKGANPFFRTQDEISEELGIALLPGIGSYPIDAVYFYGAGCAFPEKNEIVAKAIRTHLNVPTIEVGSDLLAAARGLCGRNAGIACILGTGSNSCYYDGSDIRENISPLGYVLGDEGSGAVLGRLLVGACLKNQLTRGLKEKFLSQFDLTPQLILERVYKQPLANRFLASLSPFLLQHIDDASVYELVSGAFTLFFKRNVMQYDYRRHKVHLTGSVAWYYREVLQKVAAGLDITLGIITQSPMQGLMDYYKD